MATLNLGRIKPVFRGAYSGGTAYVVDDIVTHGDESFICIQAHGAGTQATSVTAYWTKLAAKGTDGTDVGTTITTQGDILYRDGSGLQRLAKPASNKYLQNTSGGVVSWESLSSDFVKVATVNGSGSSGSLTVDNCFTADYRNYLIYCTLYADTGGQQSFWRLRSGGASGTSITSGYYMSSRQNYASSSTSGGADTRTWNGSNFEAQENTDGDANRPQTLIISVFDPFVSARDTIWQGKWGQYDGTNFRSVTGMGIHTSAGTAITGCEQYIGSGNWRTQAKITVYGMKE